MNSVTGCNTTGSGCLAQARPELETTIAMAAMMDMKRMHCACPIDVEALVAGAPNA
jgi:hypothetical protein